MIRLQVKLHIWSTSVFIMSNQSPKHENMFFSYLILSEHAQKHVFMIRMIDIIKERKFCQSLLWHFFEVRSRSQTRLYDELGIFTYWSLLMREVIKEKKTTINCYNLLFKWKAILTEHYNERGIFTCDPRKKKTQKLKKTSLIAVIAFF